MNIQKETSQDANGPNEGWHDCHDELPDFMRFTDGRPYNMTPPVEVKTFKGRTTSAFARLDWIDPVSGNALKWVRPVMNREGQTEMWSDDHVVAWRPDPTCCHSVDIVSARPRKEVEQVDAEYAELVSEAALEIARCLVSAFKPVYEGASPDIHGDIRKAIARFREAKTPLDILGAWAGVVNLTARLNPLTEIE